MPFPILQENLKIARENGIYDFAFLARTLLVRNANRPEQMHIKMGLPHK